MIQTKSEWRLWLLLALFSAFPAFAEETENDGTQTMLLWSQPVRVRVTEQDSPDTIKGKIHDLNKKLEMETGESPKTFWENTWQTIQNRFNYIHRYRVAVREQNASDGKIQQIPVPMIVINGAIPMIAIHVSESAWIGPAMISIARSEMVPEFIAYPLAAWGAAVMNPIPLGPWIDWATESFCLMTLFVVEKDWYHKGVYWIEMQFVKIVSPVLRVLGVEMVWNAIMEKQSGFEQFVRAMEKGKGELAMSTEDLNFRVRDARGKDLARLKLGLTKKSDVRLEEFELYAAAAAPEGRAELAKKLKILGRDIRDAVLQPGQLELGGHGERVEGQEIWKVNGNAVLLASAWRRRGPCDDTFAELADDLTL